MGQYYKGLKIGTCETMYYLTLPQAQELAKQGAMDDDDIAFADYISDEITKFRFCFPDEDGKTQKELLQTNNYQPHFRLYSYEGLEYIDHDTVVLRHELNDGGDSANIFIPCPYSKEFKDKDIKMSIGGISEPKLDVIMQAIRQDKETTIFRCASCGQMFRLNDEAIEKLKAYNLKKFELLNQEGKNEPDEEKQKQYDYAIKVINRIR